MGDMRKQALRVQFDGKLKLEFHGTKITSDAGVLAFRELDEAFRLTERGSTVLSDPRHGKNTQHTMLAMLRQGVYGRLAGYEDVNDADRLRVDPAMRRVVGGRAKEKEAASTSETRLPAGRWAVRDGDVEFKEELDGPDEPLRHLDRLRPRVCSARQARPGSR